MSQQIIGLGRDCPLFFSFFQVSELFSFAQIIEI